MMCQDIFQIKHLTGSDRRRIAQNEFFALIVNISLYKGREPAYRLFTRDRLNFFSRMQDHSDEKLKHYPHTTFFSNLTEKHAFNIKQILKL